MYQITQPRLIYNNYFSYLCRVYCRHCLDEHWFDVVLNNSPDDENDDLLFIRFNGNYYKESFLTKLKRVMSGYPTSGAVEEVAMTEEQAHEMTKIVTSSSKHVTTKITETLPRLVNSFENDNDNTHLSSTLMVNLDDLYTDSRLCLEFMFFYDDKEDEMYLDDILLSWSIVPEKRYNKLPNLRVKLKYLFSKDQYNKADIAVSAISSNKLLNSILTLISNLDISENKWGVKARVKNKEKLFEGYGIEK